MAYDNICRYLAQTYPIPFACWLLNVEAIKIQPLPTELSLEPIRSDALYLLPEQRQILHLEFQTVPSSSPPLPLRMLDYWVRLYRKYNCPIEQVVIFLKETSSPTVYLDQLVVGRTVHPYRVVRIWEQNPNLLLQSPALLPLAVLTQTEAPEKLLEQVAARIDRIEERQQQQNISACVEILARIKFDKNLIRQFLREDLMRESPLYQEILQEGVQQGVQRGLQQGLRQGKIDAVLLLLNSRIGSIAPDLQAQLQKLSIAQLDDLCAVLLSFSSTADLATWLQAQPDA